MLKTHPSPVREVGPIKVACTGEICTAPRPIYPVVDDHVCYWIDYADWAIGQVMAARIEVSYDGGSTWEPLAGATMEVDDASPNPTWLEVTYRRQPKPGLVRFHATIQGRHPIRLGIVPEWD